MITAKIIKDSLTQRGERLTTFVLTFPRYILAEFNTHRMFSRNSASSRAIPFKKMVESVRENPFIPIKWMKDHTGMQGDEYFDDDRQIKFLKDSWLTARDKATEEAIHLNEYGATKQMCNRLLEPYLWHTCLVTATEYRNFFALRAHKAADIHLQDLANKMLLAYNESSPEKLKLGEWHIPFGDTFDDIRILSVVDNYNEAENQEDLVLEAKIKIATARCARISYNTFEGKDDYQADIHLHDRLLKAGHWSAFEHCARVMDEDEYEHLIMTERVDLTNDTEYETKYGWCGNFHGYVQYRKLFGELENRKDDRIVIKKYY